MRDVKALERRVTATEGQLKELNELRRLVTTATPPESVVPALPTSDEAQAQWLAVGHVFPYVSSIRDKVHRVVVGYPEHPRLWHAPCSWPFGLSDVAHPVVSLPVCHLSMCDRCFKVERRVAKVAAELRVSEVGVD